MSSIDTVGVYWGPRKETASACAARLERYLSRLSEINPAFAQWFLKGGSKKETIKPIVTNDVELTKLVASGANRRDIGGDAIENLGFRVGLWDGIRDQDAISLNVKCGLFANNPNMGNSVVLGLPSDLALAGIADEQVLDRILLIGVEVWGGDWGGVFSSVSDAARSRVGTGPFFDRALWVKPSVAQSSGIKGAARCEQMLGGTFFRR
jgi:hypothetical protein